MVKCGLCFVSDQCDGNSIRIWTSLSRDDLCTSCLPGSVVRSLPGLGNQAFSVQQWRYWVDEDVNQQIVISGAQDSPNAKTGSKWLNDCKFQTMLKIPLAMADAFWENRLTSKRESMFLRSQNEADRSSERMYPAALARQRHNCSFSS